MNRKQVIRLAAASVAIVGVGIGGLLWWRERHAYEATDNAYVQAETVSVTPQIEGQVAEVLVQDNQAVRAGDVLVRLDPTNAQVRLQQAAAAIDAAKAAVRSVDDKAVLEQAMISERAAGVASAEALAVKTRADFDRNAKLAARGFVSDERLQETRASAQQGQAAVAQARAALQAERSAAAALGSNRAQTVAQVEAAAATAAQAKVDLERTVVRAPVGGVVGARAARPGQYVRPGGALMAIVPLGQTYVIANFKETQVSRLRIGQPVEIRADAFGGEPIKGVVDSFAPATGSEFALIPVENAVGNFTKIAQRLPVKIRLEPGSELAAALRPGLSVKVKVDVRGKTGASFAEAPPQPRAVAETGAPATRP